MYDETGERYLDCINNVAHGKTFTFLGSHYDRYRSELFVPLAEQEMLVNLKRFPMISELPEPINFI